MGRLEVRGRRAQARWRRVASVAAFSALRYARSSREEVCLCVRGRVEYVPHARALALALARKRASSQRAHSHARGRRRSRPTTTAVGGGGKGGGGNERGREQHSGAAAAGEREKTQTDAEERGEALRSDEQPLRQRLCKALGAHVRSLITRAPCWASIAERLGDCRCWLALALAVAGWDNGIRISSVGWGGGGGGIEPVQGRTGQASQESSLGT